MKNGLVALLLLLLCSSCAVNKAYDPLRKIGPEQLRADYSIFRNVLEESHPSLYWYTPKDSMDLYFNRGAARITDSMTENQFRYVLSYVISKIRCGHTSTMPSKAAARYNERTRFFALPFSVKAWEDTVVVTGNLNRRDSLVKRGSILLSIEGRPVKTLIDTMFNHLSQDGYNLTHKYQVLSNGGNFRTLYSSIFGLRRNMPVTFLDNNNQLRSANVEVYNPLADTPARRLPPQPRPPQPSRRERKKASLLAARNMRIDTSLNMAVMEVSTFSKGRKLRSFFRKSFKELKKKGIKNLVIDLRGNGGGHVPLSNLLTKYIADKPFKIADSLYAIRRTSKYARYRNQYFLNQLFFLFMTWKKKDGYHHAWLFEGKHYKPKKSNHFEGTTYLLTGGNTFSAAVLFATAIRDQEDVVVVGEETGGGAYGNSAWLIPDVTLPHSGVRFRLPLFRLVINRDAPKGLGVIPEVPSLPTVEAIRKGEDYKLEKVKSLIREKMQSANKTNSLTN